MSSQGIARRDSILGLRSFRFLFSFLLLSLATRALAGTTGSTALEVVQGSGAESANGDYVSAANGLNTYYSYFVEVPAGAARLDIDVFDADVGMGGNNEGTRDRERGDSWNTTTRYRVFDPLGREQTTRFTTGSRNGPAGSDNAWLNLFSAVNGAALPGHWEVRVDSSRAVTSGNDINSFGLRAHDGNPGSGGREYNLYAPSLGSYGANLSDVTSVYTQHPYVTSGCTVGVNDFDFDTEQDPLSASIELRTAGGTFDYTVAHPSTNNVWLHTPVGGWSETGVWTMTTRLSGPSGAGNYSNVYLGDTSASSPPPASQPEAHTFRLYAASDGGEAPRLPTMSQHAEVVSGPNPPVPGAATRYAITVRFANPGDAAVNVSAVSARIPGGDVVFAGALTATPGGITAQPGLGAGGTVAWVPGSIAAGGSATMSYELTVAPTAENALVALTGSGADGTRAVFVDATCAVASPACTGVQLARATYTFGPLCALSVESGSAPPSTPTPADTSTPIPTPTSVPVWTSTPAPTETMAPPPTSTATAVATATSAPADTAVPTAPAPSATPTAPPTDTSTPAPTDTPTAAPADTETETATAAPSATPTSTPDVVAHEPVCGDGVLDPGEECDRGAANSDTTPDACRTTCVLPRCGDGVPDTPVVDFVILIETSLSMRNDLRRLVDTLGPLPEQFAQGGVDYRLAVIRFGTGRLRRGPDAPEVLLDFTTDGPTYRSRIDTLQSKLTGPTESGTEAFDLALDSLHFRPNAIPVFLLFTDENDDLPISMERRSKREPPRRDWLSSSRSTTFQARLDEVAQRLIALGGRLVMLVNPHNRPTEFQYGCPGATVIDAEGKLDLAATLDALAGLGMENSLQGQLLASGACTAGRCSEGRRGFTCATDADCGLPSRAYPIMQARDANREAFFQALRDEVVEFGYCAP